MSAEMIFVLQVVVLFVACPIAAFGGILSFRYRKSTVIVRSVQFATAAFLLGLGLIFWRTRYALAVWLTPALAGLTISLQLLASAKLTALLITQVMWIVRSLSVPRQWGLLSMAVSPLILAIGLWQINDIVTPPEMPLDGIKNYPTVDLVELSDIHAYTDHGHRIPLHRVRTEAMDSLAISGDQGLPKESSPLPYRAIRLAEPDIVSNCVGWVFTGAHSWILCRHVQQILDDNGYQAVTAAHPGDLVLYRDSTGEIVHAAAVAALLDDGRPLIESKWGYQGVFLHLPEGTPYGDAWTYYRSSRPGHLLHSSSSGDQSGRALGETSP